VLIYIKAGINGDQNQRNQSCSDSDRKSVASHNGFFRQPEDGLKDIGQVEILLFVLVYSHLVDQSREL
jgi:hypothetical protein